MSVLAVSVQSCSMCALLGAGCVAVHCVALRFVLFGLLCAVHLCAMPLRLCDVRFYALFSSALL